MSDLQGSDHSNNQKSIDEARRDFLRKSVYAAYATPVIVSLLVSEASAAVSSNPGQCRGAGGEWIQGPGQSGCCDLPPITGACG